MKRAIKSQTDTGTEPKKKKEKKKEWANWVGLFQRHKTQHPHHVKVNPWGHLVITTTHLERSDPMKRSPRRQNEYQPFA